MFPDFPFDPQLNSFLPHQEVQRYLERYCQSHHIRPHIRVSRPAADHWTDLYLAGKESVIIFNQSVQTNVPNVTSVKYLMNIEDAELKVVPGSLVQ